VVVTVVVDQLAAWIAAERWPALPPEGGFARLRREGTYVREIRYEHSVNDTAPGHAALYSGAAPRESGISSNEVIPAEGGAAKGILADGKTRLIGISAGPISRAGSSLERLQVETIADVFAAAVPGAQIFSFSLKDRGAIFGGGRNPDAVLWFDPELQEFVTSTAFAARALDALAPAGNRAAVAATIAEGWDLSGPARAWVAAHAQTPDDQKGEGDYGGLGITFPHKIPSAKALRATPGGDRLVVALGQAAVAVAATNQRPTLLALSLSSHDYVAHVFGPHSWEAWDELRQIDAQLAQLMSALDRAVGPDGYAVMVTGDHGSSPLPELAGTAADPWGCSTGRASPDPWERPCGQRRRVIPEKVAATLEEELGLTLGSGHWVSGVAEPLVYLSAPARALPAAERQRLVATAKQALRPLGIDDVVDISLAGALCAPAETSRAALVCAATRPGQPGDLYLVVQPGAFFDPGYVTGFGTSHGSPYLYDRAVPLLVRAPGRVTAGRVVETPLSFASFTRTAASLLGVRPPAGARPGTDLTASR
jgi:hypothetical protein